MESYGLLSGLWDWKKKTVAGISFNRVQPEPVLLRERNRSP